MSRICIVEPGLDGHRLEYVEKAAQLITREGHHASLAVGDGFRNYGNLPPGLRGVDLLDVQLCSAPMFRGRLLDCFRLLREPKIDRLLFLNIGEFLLPLAMLSLVLPLRADVSCLNLRPSSDRPIRMLAKSLAVWVLRRRGAEVYTLRSPLTIRRPMDIYDVADLSGLAGSGVGNELARPEENFESFVNWTRLNSRPIVCCVGALSERKNVEFLLEAANALNFRVALVGQVSLSYRDRVDAAILKASRSTLFAKLERVSEAYLDEVIRLSNFAALLYENRTGSSGVLNRCWRLGTPVIGFRNMAISEAVEENGVGASIEDLSLSAFREALDQVSTMAPGELSAAALAEFEKSWGRLVIGSDVVA